MPHIQLPRQLLLLILAAAVARGEWGQETGEVAIFESPPAEAVEKGKREFIDTWIFPVRFTEAVHWTKAHWLTWLPYLGLPAAAL
jgi:hypothetical protein